MCYRCFCSIVPPDILRELSRRGSEASSRTLKDTGRIMEKRSRIQRMTITPAQISGQGERLVYDSLNRNLQRHKLVLKEGGPDTADATANGAYHLSGFVRDYFRETFGLNSIDNEGMNLISNIHFQENYNNAFWDGDEMTYGDGDLEFFRNFASAPDVVAHEITHGVTQFLSNLEYYSQAGALNEHFSDVFGTIMKQKFLKHDLQTADWLIGDLVIGEKFPGKALRSMKEPGTANEFDSQPSHMDHYYNGPDDNQGVHINSGIPNKAFYLACMETGIDDCAKIWFRTLSKLKSDSDFRQALPVFLKSAEELVRSGEVNQNAREVVARSFESVGIVQTL